MLQQFKEKLWFLFSNSKINSLRIPDFDLLILIFIFRPNWNPDQINFPEKISSFCDLIVVFFGREGDEEKAFSTWSIIPANPETWQGCRLQLPVSSYKKEKKSYLMETPTGLSDGRPVEERVTEKSALAAYDPQKPHHRVL